MRRKLLIAGIFVMLVASAGAVVTENGSSPSNNVGDGEMAITSTSPEFSSRFEIYNKTSQVSDMEEVITSSSFSESTFEFQGKAVLPTPCHSLEDTVEKTGDRTYKYGIEITRPNSSQVCTQQLVMAEYEGSVEAEPPYKVKLNHPGGEEVFNHPDFKEKRGGIIGFLLSLLPF